jgi:dsDNA-specific endonuclease/ATPase MutS2
LKHDSVQEQKIKKLERDLFEQKLMYENLKRSMANQKEEFRARGEAQARGYDELKEAMKKQSEDMTAMMKEMMEMMKKKAKPYIAHNLSYVSSNFLFVSC